MFCNNKLVFTAVLAALASQVSAHGTITAVTGANGVDATGFGIIASTPRDGGLPVPFEQDTSVIRDNEIASGKTGVCGSTKAGGNNDVASQLAAASAAGLPTAAADGSVTMTLHQVNQDGAGPYTCDVSTDGGNTFSAATVSQNVPGVNGLSLSVAKNFTLVAQMPAGTACAGGPNGDACIMRCRNPALAGPFGSCVAVTTASNTTAAASSVAATSAAVATAAASSVAAPPAAASSVAAAPPAAVSSVAAAPAAATPAVAAAPAAGGAKKGGLLGKLFGGNKRAPAAKRITTSRVAGKRAGYWIDA